MNCPTATVTCLAENFQVHGNICVASVVVTVNLDWKVHAFDVLSEFDATNPDPASPMLVSDLAYFFCNLAKADIISIE